MGGPLLLEGIECCCCRGGSSKEFVGLLGLLLGEEVGGQVEQIFFGLMDHGWGW